MAVRWHELRAWFIGDGYLWDWLAAAAAILIGCFVPVLAVKPIHRFYTPGDPTLSYPYEDNTISGTVLYLLVFLWPAVLVTLATALLTKSWTDWHHVVLSYAEGFGLVVNFKRWINVVGVLRPSWFALLALDEAGEGRVSYPSGHSAYMFYSGTILTLWMAGKLRLLAPRPGVGQFAKALLCLAPIALATFVAVSRIANYKHAPADVNAGCFIGMLCGALCYFLNYPSLFAEDCASPKLRGTEPVGSGSGGGGNDKDGEMRMIPGGGRRSNSTRNGVLEA